jgi:hypothetical protein
MKLVRKKGDDLWRQWDPETDDCMDADIETMSVEPDIIRHAEAVFSVYSRFGIGEVPNYFSSQKLITTKSDVVSAVQFPTVRQRAENLLLHYQQKVEELQSILGDI